MEKTIHMKKKNLSINLSVINRSDSAKTSDIGNVEADEYEDMIGEPRIETNRMRQ